METLPGFWEDADAAAKIQKEKSILQEVTNKYDKVKEKFESFAHEEYNKEKYKNEKHIKECIETGEDLFGRKIKKKKKIEKNFFPRDLLKLMEQNPKFYFGSSS